jgi:hypothetical protein
MPFMMQLPRPHLIAALATAIVLSGPVLGEEGENVNADELIVQMGLMQRHLQKLDLSVQAGNETLAGFYIHELEELIETVAEAGVVYHGYPVGAMTEAQLPPAIEAIEAALGSGADADAAVGELVDRCNACHAATDRPWLVITRARGNPFNQDFGP